MLDHAISLTTTSIQGRLLKAVFLPEQGMNLVSYSHDAVEVIDQSTKPLFDERSSGLGPIIGPHFHERNPACIPALTAEQEQLFPLIARMRAKGRKDPFSHGVGRYAPWQITAATEISIQARLTGKDLWNGVPLELLEGQNFAMEMDVELLPTGLTISLSVVSDTDSIVGIHYYYHLPSGRGRIISDVQERYYDPIELRPIPSTWNYEQHQLIYDLAQNNADFAFHPFHDPLSGVITLDTTEYTLKTMYRAPSQENAWQLYHPQGTSFVCIEPISAQNPRKANLSVSSIVIRLEIVLPDR